MAHTKTAEVQINWLGELDGKTVADAVAYLLTLDQSHVLDYTLEGDTHGCSLSSCLTYQVPMSDAEILASIEKGLTSQIERHEKALIQHVLYKRQDRVTQCEALISRLKANLEDARNKYAPK